MPSEPSARPPLGKLEKIDLLAYWQGEEAGFTPWLAQPEHLQILGDSLGLVLEVVVGNEPLPNAIASGQSASLLCCDRATGSQVLIESQLGKTDSLHLGQLISRAAALQADTVVWIASQVVFDYQLALQWLNSIGQPKAAFFGVELELWRVGGAAMAINFNPVAYPAAWSPAATATAAAPPEPEPEPEPEEPPLSSEQQQLLDFWSGLCEQLERRGSIVKSGSPEPQTTMGFAIGRAGFRLYASFDPEDRCFYVELELLGEDAHPHFYLLAEEQAEIAAEVGLPLIWDDQAGEKACAIYCVLPEVDLDAAARWPDYWRWLSDALELLHEVFSGRIKQLNAMDYQPLPDYSFDPRHGSLSLPS